jgi:hypothetical protein
MFYLPSPKNSLWRLAETTLLAGSIATIMVATVVAQTNEPVANTKPLKSLFQPAPAQQLESEPVQPMANRLNQRQVEEIEALRKQMGGGVGERLKGVVPGVDPNQKFRQQLENLVREKESPARRFEPKNVPRSTAPLSLPNPSTRQRLQAFPGNKATRAAQIATSPPTQQEVLRESAAGLERLAAEMESVGLYEQADQLRSTAKAFWQSARGLD